MTRVNVRRVHGIKSFKTSVGGVSFSECANRQLHFPSLISRDCACCCGTMTEAELYSVYRGVYLPKALYPPKALQHYEEFSFRQDDVIIITYPKSGELIGQVMFSCLQHQSMIFIFFSYMNYI